MQRISFKVGNVKIVSYSLRETIAHEPHHYYYVDGQETQRHSFSLSGPIGDGLMVHGIRTIGAK